MIALNTVRSTLQAQHEHALRVASNLITTRFNSVGDTDAIEWSTDVRDILQQAQEQDHIVLAGYLFELVRTKHATIMDIQKVGFHQKVTNLLEYCLGQSGTRDRMAVFTALTIQVLRSFNQEQLIEKQEYLLNVVKKWCSSTVQILGEDCLLAKRLLAEFSAIEIKLGSH